MKSPNDGVKPLTPVALREAAREGCISAPAESPVPSILVYQMKETVSFCAETGSYSGDVLNIIYVY